MVRRFWTPVNAGDRRQSWSRESWLRQARDKHAIACLRASALRGQLQITFQQPAGRTLGLTGVAEELAFEAVEAVGRSEETIAAGIPYNDAGRYRTDFDDVAVGH